MTLQAVILAAGEGIRLRPLTQNRPKALIPVANKPIIEHTIHSLISVGIRDIFVVVGYRKEQVMRHLARMNIPTTIIIQDKPLGTAHAFLCAKPKIIEDVLILPGDNYIDPESLKDIVAQKNAILYTTHRQPSNFGVVTIEGDNITSITEKPTHAERMTVSCGIYHISSDIINRITNRSLSEAMEEEIQRGTKITAVKAHSWQDAIYPWDLLPMNEKLLSLTSATKAGYINNSSIKGQVTIGAGTVIGPGTIITGQVVIGEDCIIGPHVVIESGCSIGSRVRIEPFSFIRNSILMNDVVIASHSTLSGSILGEGCTVGEHTIATPKGGFIPMNDTLVRSLCGVIMGNGVYCSPSVLFENTIIGNDTMIDGRTEKRFSCEYIPDKSRVM